MHKREPPKRKLYKHSGGLEQGRYKMAIHRDKYHPIKLMSTQYCGLTDISKNY